MSRTLPEGCPRGLICQPLARVQSDDGKTFVCCGLWGRMHAHLKKGGTLEGFRDPYRLCFKSEDTDTRYDYDELDLIDEAEVILRGLSTARRIMEVAVASGDNTESQVV